MPSKSVSLDIRWLSRVSHAGLLPTDSEEERAGKIRLTFLMLLLIPTGLVWALAHGLLVFWGSALISFFYSLFSSVSLIHFVITKRYRFFAQSQFLLLLFLPVLQQWSLGGFVHGSAIAIFAILSPIGV